MAFDALNAIIYAARGDYINAGLSAAATIPVAGWAATGGKFVNKAYTVYHGIDKAGVIRYIGMTRRSPAVRFAEHLKSIGTGKELLKYDIIEGAEGLTKTEAKVMEQLIINQYGLQKNGGLLPNQINSGPKYWNMYGIK